MYKNYERMKLKSLTIASMAVFALTFTACSGNSKKSETETNEAQASAVQTIDELLERADSLVGTQVTFQGVCTHTCKHGATKMFMMGSDDTKTIRVEAGELGSFDTKCVNSMVEVTGTLVEQRIDEAYLQKWEAQAKSQTAKTHGEGEAGCDSEKKARGETGNTVEERIADFRAKIARRKADTGKDYLSFYYVEAKSYAIK